MGFLSGLKKIGSAATFGMFDDKQANPYDAPETAEQKAKRMAAEGDVNVMRGYRDRLGGLDTGSRDATQVSAPGQVGSANVARVGGIGAGPQVQAGNVQSTYSTQGQAGDQALQQGYMQRLQAVENGTAGPSAAELQSRAGGAAAVSQAYAMAGGNKGYSGAALRNAQRVGAGLQQQNVMQTGILRANEVANARQQYGQAVDAARSQDISMAGTGAQLALQAAQGNQQTGLSAQVANQNAQLEAAKANQAAALQENLTKAGFDQASIMKMSDQELATKLANAGFKVSQEQIDDLRAHNVRQQQMDANAAVLGGDQAADARAQHLKELQAQYAAAIATLALGSTPSSAAMMGCSGDNMMKANNSLSATADGPNKMMAYKEISMAQSDMLKGNMRGCTMHMNNN